MNRHDTHNDAVLDATFRVVDVHDTHDCDDSCMGCVDCHQATGASVCDRLCPHATVDDRDCDVRINLRRDDVDLDDDDDDDDDDGHDGDWDTCTHPDCVAYRNGVCDVNGHDFDSALNLDGGRCRVCGVRR
jgi:hypothetical protein